MGCLLGELAHRAVGLRQSKRGPSSAEDGLGADVLLSSVMSENPHRLQEEDTIAQALNYMAVGGYRHLPIVHDGNPIGFCSIRGILRYISENALEV